jgi:excisionase family DNA binding protein
LTVVTRVLDTIVTGNDGNLIRGRPITAVEIEELVKEGAVTLNETHRLTGLGRSFLYQLMDSKQLHYLKIGKRRLIPRSGIIRLLASPSCSSA